MAIRSYGPGKFIKIIDSYAYGVTLDGGADEEASYPDAGGWYGLLRLDKGARDQIHQAAHYEEDDLTEDESDLLDDSKAIIFCERSDGIVEADWFDDMSKAEQAWEEIEAEVGGDDEEEDEVDELGDEIAGYEIKETATGARRVSVDADNAEDALDEIRDALPNGWEADFAGEGNTDDRGHSTEDISIRRKS